MTNLKGGYEKVMILHKFSTDGSVPERVDPMELPVGGFLVEVSEKGRRRFFRR